MNAKCSYIFPTPILQRDSEELLNKQLITNVLDIIQKHGSNPFYSPCISTIKNLKNVLLLPELIEIQSFIVECISTYCEFTKIEKNGLYISDSWLNLYNEHGYQDLHTHEDSVLSGVFYLEANNKSDLVFQAPWHFFQPTYARFTETDLNNCHNLEYQSVTGRCYIFPSHLMHRTLPTKDRRISLSFNVRQDR